MQKLVNPANNNVIFGEIGDEIDINYKDYKLKSIFDNNLPKIIQKYRFHKFNFILIITDNNLIGIGIVGLSYISNIFVFSYSILDKEYFEIDKKVPFELNLNYPVNPDNYNISFKNNKDFLLIEKSKENSFLKIKIDFDKKFMIDGQFFYGNKTNNPLRICAPNGINCWTFTEKCSCIEPTYLKININNKPIQPDLLKTTLLYDWSCGYMKRLTNWHWAAFSAVDPNLKMTLGGNFASFINETYITENAYWVDHQIFKLNKIIFDFEDNNPDKIWTIKSDDNKVLLKFSPLKKRVQRLNLGLLKIYFRQYLGIFSGTLHSDNKKEIHFENAWGVTEIQRALW
ncbi:MAG TPA: DUF2804 domain-containing protein [Exilispira sp.]|nr:DUF2804 domain-containing protein [Exilispira sp.]